MKTKKTRKIFSKSKLPFFNGNQLIEKENSEKDFSQTYEFQESLEIIWVKAIATPVPLDENLKILVRFETFCMLSKLNDMVQLVYHVIKVLVFLILTLPFYITWNIKKSTKIAWKYSRG